MKLQNLTDKLFEQRKFISVRKASFYKWVELDQLFRLIVGVFLLLLVADMFGGFQGQRPWMFGVILVYLVFNGLLSVMQNFWRALRAINDWRICVADLIFFTLFLIIGGDISHIFSLNFLFVSYCVGLKLGTRRGSALLTLNVLAFAGVKLFFELNGGSLRIGHVGYWTTFIAVAGYALARLSNSIRVEIEKSRMLRRLRGFISAEKGINVVCDFITAEVLRFFGAARASVLLFSNSGDDSLRAVHLDNNDEAVVVIDGIPRPDIEILKAVDLQRTHLYIRRNSKETVLEYWKGEWKETSPFKDFDKLRPDYPDMTVAMVPLGEGSRVFGRLFVRGAVERPLNIDDTWFLLKVVRQLGLYLETVRLSERISEEAAETERRRIALDLHDGVVQPYIGLQLGISALKQKASMPEGVASSDFERLDLLAKDGVRDLREYIRGLRDGTRGDWSLIPAIGRYISKFTEATGIEVIFEHDSFEKTAIAERLSVDIFQMICEAVSNARKHTNSTRIVIGMRRSGADILVSIEDEGETEGSTSVFVPRSITQRAALNGGTVKVVPTAAGGVRVTIEIPTHRKL